MPPANTREARGRHFQRGPTGLNKVIDHINTESGTASYIQLRRPKDEFSRPRTFDQMKSWTKAKETVERLDVLSSVSLTQRDLELSDAIDTE